VHQLHYTHHQVILMVLRYTTLGLCIGPACEAGLSAGMRREHVPPQKRKKEKKKVSKLVYSFSQYVHKFANGRSNRRMHKRAGWQHTAANLAWLRHINLQCGMWCLPVSS